MKSIHFRESIPIIAAVFSTGEYFIHICSDSVDAKTFIGFLVDLKKYIRSNRVFKNRSFSILMDNASTHRAKDSLSNLKENFNTVIFIPPYTPQYSPIEHFFGFLKSSIKACRVSKLVNIRSGEGEEMVKTWASRMRPESIVRWFSHWFGIMREDLRAYGKMRNIQIIFIIQPTTITLKNIL